MEGSVEVDEDVVAGSLTSHTLVEVDHPLILTVHEVDLHAPYAPLLEALEEIHVVLHRQPRQPDDDANALFLGIGYELGQVHIGVGVEGVARVERPAFVH